jgi:hypothetical protein
LGVIAEIDTRVVKNASGDDVNRPDVEIGIGY